MERQKPATQNGIICAQHGCIPGRFVWYVVSSPKDQPMLKKCNARKSSETPLISAMCTSRQDVEVATAGLGVKPNLGTDTRTTNNHARDKLKSSNQQ
jgi:hypothetical protein